MSLRMQGSSAISAHAGKRAEGRARVAIEAKIETVLGHASAYVLNLSCHGAMVQTDTPPVRGNDVVLKCGPLDALGVVAWVQHQHFGMEFDEAVPEAVVVELRRAADEAVRHMAHRRLGRPSVGTRALTAEEWQAAQEWGGGSGNFL